MKRLGHLVLLVGGIFGAMSAEARADVILSGPDANDGTYSTAALAAAATSSDTVTYGGYTGITLWGLLGGANASSPTSPTYGAITTTTPAGDNGKNAILRDYVVASGGGGTSVVSLGEIDPNFGGTAPTPTFVAYSGPGNTPLATPQLIVPGQAARDISGLSSLSLQAAPALPTGAGGQSTAVTLTGQAANVGTYTGSDLKSKFTPTTVIAKGDTYTGVPLFTFVKSKDGNSLGKIVITAGTDGYEVVLAMAELDPGLGGDPNDILPYADTGTDFPTDGIARTVLVNDNRPGRWVSNLDLIDVESVPEPGTLALFGTNLLLGLGVLGWRSTRAKALLHPTL